MNIYLDAPTSLMIVRMAASNRSIALTPTDECRPSAPHVGTAKLWRLGIPELLGCLGVPDQRELGIVVPGAGDRVRAKGIRCTVDSMTRLGSGFLRLGSADPCNPSPLVSAEATVYVQSPASIVLGSAPHLCKLERMRRISHHQAVLLLVRLCLELCGTYSHDPHDPKNGSVVYKVAPRLTKDELTGFLRPAGQERGLILAREAASLAYDLSGSPQESFLGPALFFEPRLGGLNLCEFEANVPLQLSAEERASIGRRIITPDFTLVRYHSVVEYLGAVHAEADNPNIDHRRSLDYQTLGMREFSFWYADVDTLAHFNASAARVVKAIGDYDGPAVGKRFAELLGDAEFRKRQRELFAVFRPWLR